MESLLLATVFLPLAGAALVWILADKGQAVVRQSALITTLITCVLAGILISRFTPDKVPFAFGEMNWLGGAAGLNVRMGLGLDGLSVWLFGLTSLLMITSVLVSWEAISDRPGDFYGLLLLLESGMLGVFAAQDIILFYVFFEFTLIPLFFLIGVWGSEDRRYAAVKFFIFTLAGSLLTFLGLVTIVLWNGSHPGHPLTFSIAELTKGLAAHPLPLAYQWWIFLALFAGFAIKVPLFPLHTWLPLAHTEAPTAGSVILAGVLLKLGTYGLIRLAVPIGLLTADSVAFPRLIHFLGCICVVGVIYGALVAWVQQDIKKLVAYSSVSHLGFCVLGMIALNTWGLEGSVLYMINHGLSTGAMFLVVGMIYDRYHTRDINQLSGLARRMPIMAFFFVFFTLASIGLPGLNGFVSEFLTILGAFTSPYLGIGFGAFAALGIILGAVYMLHMVARVIFGPLKTPEVHGEHGDSRLPTDIGRREIAILVPLALVVAYLGVYPSGVLRSMNDPFDRMRQPISTVESRLAHETPTLTLPLSTRGGEVEAPAVNGKPEETLVMKP